MPSGFVSRNPTASLLPPLTASTLLGVVGAFGCGDEFVAGERFDGGEEPPARSCYDYAPGEICPPSCTRLFADVQMPACAFDPRAFRPDRPYVCHPLNAQVDRQPTCVLREGQRAWLTGLPAGLLDVEGFERCACGGDDDADAR